MHLKRNRRELPRAPLDVPAAEELFSSTQEVVAIDLSELGMRYRKPALAPRRESAEVFLHLQLPGSHHAIGVLGCVANERVVRDQRHTSVTFAFLQPEDAAAIRNYVRINAAPTECRPPSEIE